MAKIIESPSLSTIISDSKNASENNSSRLIEANPIGQVVNVISSVPYKPEVFARSREDAIGKYQTVRYSMNNTINSSSDLFYDAVGGSYLSVVPSSLGNIPSFLNPGAPPDNSGYSVKFNQDGSFLSGINSFINETQMNSNTWSVEVMMKTSSSNPSSMVSIWAIEDGVNVYSLVLTSSNVLGFYNKTDGTTTVINTSALANNTWYNITLFFSGSLIYTNINGVPTTPASITKPTFYMNDTSNISVGGSKYLSLISANSFNGSVESIVFYNGVGEDRTTPWTGTAVNSSYWRYRSSFYYRNTPPGWLLCDGSNISRSNYSKLFNQIGTTQGPGDGSTTFQLPPSAGSNYNLIRSK